MVGNKFLGLLKSRKFWLLVVALVVLIVGNVFYEGFALDGEAATGFLVILATYMVGLVIDPGEPRAKWVKLLKSRKFYAAGIGLVVMVMASFDMVLPFGVSEDQLLEIAVAFGSYIAAVAMQARFPVIEA